MDVALWEAGDLVASTGGWIYPVERAFSAIVRGIERAVTVKHDAHHTRRHVRVMRHLSQFGGLRIQAIKGCRGGRVHGSILRIGGEVHHVPAPLNGPTSLNTPVWGS